MTKLIPAAMTDFKKIIENNYAFVDKTRFLEVMYYYDIALKEEADRLFKGKYIASHPTPQKSSYYSHFTWLWDAYKE